MSELFSLTGPVWVELGLVLAHAVWQGAAIAMTLAVVLRLLGRWSADVRYGACGVALVLMAACPLLTFAYLRVAPPAILNRILVASREVSASAEPVSPSHASSEVPTGTPDETRHDDIVLSPSDPMRGISAVGNVGDAFEPASQVEPATGLIDGSAIGSLFARPDTPEERLAFGLSLAAWVWAGGVAVLALRLLVGWMGLHRLRRSGTEALPAAVQQIVEKLRAHLGLGARVSVLASDSVREPVAFGLIRPIVLLPVSLLTRCPVELVEAMLVHELAHIRRLDLWVNLGQRVIETFLFYHPAVWWISGRMRLERELCCDDLAIRVTGRRAEYAEALVDMARAAYGIPAPALAAGMFTSRMTMLTRVRRVLGLPPAAQHGRFWLAGPLSLLLAGSMVLVSRIHAADDERKDPTTAVAEAPTTETDAVSDTVASDASIDATSVTYPQQIAAVAADLHAMLDSVSVATASASEVTGPAKTAATTGAPPKTSIIKTHFDEVTSFKSRLDEQRAWIAPVLDVIKGFQAFHAAVYKPDREALRRVFRPEGRTATADDVEQLFADLEALGLDEHKYLWSDPWDIRSVYAADEVGRALVFLGYFSVKYHGRSWPIRIECRLTKDDDLGWFVTDLAASATEWNLQERFEQFAESLRKNHPENPDIVIRTVSLGDGRPRKWKEIVLRAGEGAPRDGWPKDVRLMVGVNRKRFVDPIRNAMTRPSPPRKRRARPRRGGGRVPSSEQPAAAAPAASSTSSSRGGARGRGQTARRSVPTDVQGIEAAPSVTSAQPRTTVASTLATLGAALSRRPTASRFGGDSTAMTEHQYVVRSRTDGLVDKVEVKRGQRVKKGQVLVALDSADAQFEVRAAELTARSARQDLMRITVNKSLASAAETHKANVAVDTAELALERSQHRFERTRIVSPVDGVVVEIRRTASPGKKISAGDDLIVIDTRPGARWERFHYPANTPSTPVRPSARSRTATPRPAEAVPETDAGDSRIQTPATPIGQSQPTRPPFGGGGGGVGRFGGAGGMSADDPFRSADRGPRQRGVFAPVEGLIADVAVKVGQRVKKGDVLVRLDSSDAEFALRAAKIHLESAESAYAKSNELRASHAISEREFLPFKSALELARLEVDRAMHRLGRMRVSSPIDGVVRRLFPVTTPGAKVEAGKLLLRIEPTGDAAGAVPPGVSTNGGSRGVGVPTPPADSPFTPRRSSAASSEDPRRACMLNLKALGIALHIYANDNFELFRSDDRSITASDIQAALVEAGHIATKQTRCPHAPPDHAAYIHLPAAMPFPGANLNPRDVVVYEHPDNHGGGGLNVLFADAHCEYMTVEAFEEALAQTKRRLAVPPGASTSGGSRSGGHAASRTPGGRRGTWGVR